MLKENKKIPLRLIIGISLILSAMTTFMLIPKFYTFCITLISCGIGVMVIMYKKIQAWR